MFTETNAVVIEEESVFLFNCAEISFGMMIV
jgi:hypothetical protein